jgi:hypothetical protein
MRAKGGAGTGMFHPHRSVRQTNDVKVPRQRREDRQPLSGTRLRLTDKYYRGAGLVVTTELLADHVRGFARFVVGGVRRHRRRIGELEHTAGIRQHFLRQRDVAVELAAP